MIRSRWTAASPLAVTISPPFGERANAVTALLDLSGDARVDRAYVHPERRRRGLNDGELADPGSDDWIAKHGRTRHARRDLLEQLQPFRADDCIRTA